MPCDKCEKLHEGWGKEPNCKNCIPTLFPENREAVRVYIICQDQMIMSMSGPVSLDISAIEIAMERCRVRDKNKTFHQVIKLGQHFIGKMREKDNG